MKKKMIKILCLMLALWMSIGMISVSADDSTSNVMTEKMDILRMFGIIPDYYDFNTSFGENVSRADFADVVARLINADEYGGDTVYYYDVLKSHYAYNSISSLTELGVINGTGDKLFKPDLPMETVAAYKILVCLLGYGDIALRSGGYPAGYIDVARKIDIYEETSGGNLTRGEMINMIYNALNTKTLSLIGYTNDGNIVISESEDTLLSMYHDIYYGEGTVNGANCISISDYNLDESEEVMIDDEIYTTENDVIDYLGQKVEFYWFDNEKENKKELLWVKAKNNKDTVYLEIDDNASFDSKTFDYTYYTENGSRRTINLDRGATLIYNGRTVESGFGTVLNKDRYSVKFVKTNNVYDFIFVKAYENYIVDSYDSVNGSVYDRTGTKDMLKLKDNSIDFLSVKTADGNKTELSAIKAGDVLSVFKSLDGKYIEVFIGTDAKSGVIKGLSSKNGKYTIKLADASYYMPVKAFEENPEKIKVGDNVKLYLDYTGEVAYVEIQTGGDSAAYVIDVAPVKEGFTEEIRFKLLMQDGSIATLVCDETITLDGNKKADFDDIKTKFIKSDGNIEHQLILVKTNADGIIKKIDTAEVKEINGETKANSLWKTYEGANERYKSHGSFGYMSAINNETVFFEVPVSNDNLNEEKRYRIIAKNSFINDINYNIATYNTTERSGYDQYVIVKRDDILDDGRYSNILPVLVTTVGEGLTGEGEVVELIEGYQGAQLKTFLSDGEYSFTSDGIKPGMLIQLKTNPEGEVGGLYNDKPIYDPQNPGAPQTALAAVGVYMANVGYVHDVVGDVIKFGIKSGADIDCISMNAGAPVLVWDSRNDREPAYIGSFSDAVRYYNVEDDKECSKVVMISRHLTPRLYVIYK